MSEEMAVNEQSSSDDAKTNGNEASVAATTASGDVGATPAIDQPGEKPETTSGQPSVDGDDEGSGDAAARKRRASSAFSNPEENEDFKGFDQSNLDESIANYSQILDRMEAEVSAVSETLTPVRNITATPTARLRLNKRLRKDTGTDGSRPSSALSSRSEGDGVASSTDPPSSAASSPAHRRKTTTEMSSPLLRVPLERGWKRELVYRAALDIHSRRNADIYYYTPAGKKLRSNREVAEHLFGTGLTLENFSFFKEALGVDDPEKEIIRDAKLIRRIESPPVAPPPVTSEKRARAQKLPKGASPEQVKVKSPPPAKIKVKSLGSRLSTNTPPSKLKKQAASTPTTKATTPATKATTPTAKATTPTTKTTTPTAKTPTTKSTTVDNNNTGAWKKPRPAPPPPPTQVPPAAATTQAGRAQEPCSIACSGSTGQVPTLSCDACLCLYHPRCVTYVPGTNFLCANCRPSPSTEPSTPAPKPAEPRPVPPRDVARPPEQRVLLRMKVSGSGETGERVWAVSRPVQDGRTTLPQSLAIMNGKRFIVVPRNVIAPRSPLARGRVANGGVLQPPRRRGRPKDDVDHFTDMYNKGKELKYNIALQIFQYLGMRELAAAARVCRLWREMAAQPQLWTHVRMKNSHVSDWAGLCTLLKKHGTKRLDLRKMLLPQNDTPFWESFAQHIATIDTLERIEMCRCPASAVEAVARYLPKLKSLSALAIRDTRLDPQGLGKLTQLKELRLKSMAGLALASDLTPLANLTKLTHLSLTSIKELGCSACEVVGTLSQLESLELGECTFRASFGTVLSKLQKLKRLRLERGTAECAAPALLRALATLPSLTQLELVNFDVKVGFDEALAECKNVQRLLIIPTYVSQSATTNRQVLSGILSLADSLTHLMWGVTIELLRVTELFIDQCEQGKVNKKKKEIGECIPVLKPVPGCKLPDEPRPKVMSADVTQQMVEILPLPTLQRLLSVQLPHTKLKLLRIPFHATWRQSLADFQ